MLYIKRFSLKSIFSTEPPHVEQISGLDRMTETTNQHLPAPLEVTKRAHFTLQVCFHAEFFHKTAIFIILHCKHYPAANIVKI